MNATQAPQVKRTKKNHVSTKYQGEVKAHNNGYSPAIIPARQLALDPAVQRWTPTRRSKEIADNFDWEAVGRLDVARRGKDRFSIVDGQNRFKAITQLWPDYVDSDGKEIMLNVDILSATGAQAEATRSIKFNSNQKALSPNDLFWLGLTAEDPDVLACNRIMKSAGIHFKYGEGQPGPNETRFGGAFKQAYLQLGTKMFRLLLKCLTTAYTMPDSIIVEPIAIRATFIQALVKVLQSRVDLTEDQILKCVHRGPSATEAIAYAANRQLKDDGLVVGWKRTQYIVAELLHWVPKTGIPLK